MSTKIKMSTYYIIKNEYKIKMSTSSSYMPMLKNNIDIMCKKQRLDTMARLHNMVTAIVNIITMAIKQTDNLINNKHDNYIDSMDTKTWGYNLKTMVPSKISKKFFFFFFFLLNFLEKSNCQQHGLLNKKLLYKDVMKMAY